MITYLVKNKYLCCFKYFHSVYFADFSILNEIISHYHRNLADAMGCANFRVWHCGFFWQCVAHFIPSGWSRGPWDLPTISNIFYCFQIFHCPPPKYMEMCRLQGVSKLRAIVLGYYIQGVSGEWFPFLWWFVIKMEMQIELKTHVRQGVKTKNPKIF